MVTIEDYQNILGLSELRQFMNSNKAALPDEGENLRKEVAPPLNIRKPKAHRTPINLGEEEARH